MLRLPTYFLMVLLYTAHGDGQSKTSGISQFWTDDYKVFDQIYGKTSDKHLYGVTLPPSISFDGLSTPKLAASEKFERYLPNIHDLSDFTDDKYAKLFSKSLYDDKKKGSALQFISFSDFKPISADSDPETYKYLKHLDHENEYKIDVKHFDDNKYGIDFRDKGYGDFKPYKQFDEEKDAYKSIQDILDAHKANGDVKHFDGNKYGIDFRHKGYGDFKPFTQPDADIEEKDAYKSIQDILDAHEANGGKKDDEVDLKEKRKNNYGTKNRNKVRPLNGNGIKAPCTTGRCRKRYANAPVSRPYVRKIHYRYLRR